MLAFEADKNLGRKRRRWSISWGYDGDIIGIYLGPQIDFRCFCMINPTIESQCLSHALTLKCLMVHLLMFDLLSDITAKFKDSVSEVFCHSVQCKWGLGHDHLHGDGCPLLMIQHLCFTTQMVQKVAGEASEVPNPMHF